MCYSCGCSCGCSASCSCYQSVCPQCCSTTTSTTTTTTINPDCEVCEEIFDCACIEYTGENIECYGLSTGDNLCEILETIIQNLPECKTTLPPNSCSFAGTAVIV